MYFLLLCLHNRSVRTAEKCSARTVCWTKSPCHRPSPLNVCATCATPSYCSNTPQTPPESLNTLISVKNIQNWNPYALIHIWALITREHAGFFFFCCFEKGVFKVLLYLHQIQHHIVDEWCPPSGLMQYYLNCLSNQLYVLIHIVDYTPQQRYLTFISGVWNCAILCKKWF